MRQLTFRRLSPELWLVNLGGLLTLLAVACGAAAPSTPGSSAGTPTRPAAAMPTDDAG
jgi:hypothetical protein